MDSADAELNRLVEAGLPGAFLYIEDGDGATQFFTAGYADLETRRRMTPDDHYRVGSTTKALTAIVVLQLIAEGMLALQDTMRACLPDLAIPNADRLTVEHLLRMRSSLFDFEDDPSLLDNLEAHLQPVSLMQAVDFGIRHPPTFTPGAKFSYCNTNYCILEMIVERITGNTLGAEFQRRIFEPVGLTATRYPDENDLTLPEPYIRGYERVPNGWQECSRVFFGRGDGALISTAPDLARFFRALLIDKSLVAADLLKQMTTVVQDDPPADEDYGLGLMSQKLPCAILWGHAGGGYGYGNLPYIRLDTGRFAVFMINGSYGFRVPSGERPRITPEFRASVYC